MGIEQPRRKDSRQRLLLEGIRAAESRERARNNADYGRLLRFHDRRIGQGDTDSSGTNWNVPNGIYRFS